jgi:hypothetical protein
MLDFALDYPVVSAAFALAGVLAVIGAWKSFTAWWRRRRRENIETRRRRRSGS